MEKERLLYGMIAISGLFMPIIGIIIGYIRYKKNKDKIAKEVHERYKEAQERGGVSSLYYKYQEKQIFARTFGTPIYIGLFLGLALMLIGFSGL